jgi:hypothetical protein
MYNEPVNEDTLSSIIENIYNITRRGVDYVNLTAEGELRWRSVHSYDTNSKYTMDKWKNKLYEISTRKCA